MKWLLLSMILLFAAGCLEDLKQQAKDTAAALKTEDGRADVGEDLADAGATVSMIPHPTAIAVGAGMIFIGNLMGKRKGNKSGLQHGLGIATDIVDFVEQQKDDKGTVRFGDERVKTELNRLMGPEHIAIVEGVRGK